MYRFATAPFTLPAKGERAYVSHTHTHTCTDRTSIVHLYCAPLLRVAQYCRVPVV